ncbi:GNAT family N-acetyltransferase [Leptolyngbya ohadii]|uniref:GNAT family N-acetyltransferase n=1 Tax=Leptolyngbya ohadii TaxID=1962290 RepID=UPI000B5A024F|nr:GNAT family N-acetyltransferase [Leptolyngbya ohadii]
MFKVRSAQLTDCDDLVALCHELGYRTSAEMLLRQLEAFQSHPDHAVFVAEAMTDRVIGGWVHVHLHCTLQEGQEAEIGGLVVAKEFRGQGVGKQLVQRAELWAQKQECSAIVVRSKVQRSDAHQFYQRAGYREIKRSIVFRQVLPTVSETDAQF